jgi:hypothetical protein
MQEVSMGYFVRSMLIIFGVMGFMLIAQPSVAFATRVTLIRVSSVDMQDEVLAFELTNDLHASASRVAGWGVSISSMTLPQILASNNCGDGTVPDTACLVHLTNTPGSGAYGPIIIYGTLQRRGEGDDMRIELDLVLFDTVSGAEPRHVVANLTEAELNDVEGRRRLIQGWLVQLMTGIAPSADTPIADGSGDSPPPPTRTGDSREALEIAGWSLVGTAGASAIVAIIAGSLLVGLNNDAQYVEYRSSWDAGRVSSVCAEAANDPSEAGRHALGVCNDAQAYEVLVPLLWTVAGLAGAAGTVLAWHPWIGASPAERPTARLIPTLSPTRAGLALTLEF